MKKYEREIKALGNAVVRDDGAMLVVATDGEMSEEHAGLIGDAADCIILVEQAFNVVLEGCTPLERAFIADQLLRVAIEQSREATKILDDSRRKNQ